jgi:hypothetical protein
VIGYYVHHHGSGHLHRATALARAAADRDLAVTGLSSLPRPHDWPGAWLTLPRDDGDTALRPTAHGHLHWAPLGHDGLRERTTTISAWIEESRPDAVVVDVSVEVTLLVRLHGVPVVSVVLPGARGDAAHLLGLGVADALVAVWPTEATGMLRDVPEAIARRLQPVGALSRFPLRPPGIRRPGPGRVVLMAGTGGHDLDRERIEQARAASPDWHWTVLGRDLGTWVEDPAGVLADADVVVTHAGQNALAEVAALRRPAVVVPQDRPHHEQRTTARVLRDGGWPVVVEDRWPDGGWDARLTHAATRDGRLWTRWCDGGAADRFLDVVTTTAGAR